MATKGKITHWNRRKAYGFITPADGDKEVFAHISEFGDRSNQPELGQWVEYTMSTDKRGRVCATQVALVEESDTSVSGRSYLLWVILGVAAVLVAAGILFLSGKIP